MDYLFYCYLCVCLYALGVFVKGSSGNLHTIATLPCSVFHFVQVFDISQKLPEEQKTKYKQFLVASGLFSHAFQPAAGITSCWRFISALTIWHFIAIACIYARLLLLMQQLLEKLPPIFVLYFIFASTKMNIAQKIVSIC